jgi:hypothetical protein
MPTVELISETSAGSMTFGGFSFAVVSVIICSWHYSAF